MGNFCPKSRCIPIGSGQLITTRHPLQGVFVFSNANDFPLQSFWDNFGVKLATQFLMDELGHLVKHKTKVSYWRYKHERQFGTSKTLRVAR